MKKILFMLMIVSFISATVFAQSKDVKAIIEVMREEERAWNSGDVESYVNLYAPLDSTRMILATNSAYGKAAILAFYKKYWPKDKMGTLSLTSDSIEKINKKNYYVTGFFQVVLPDKKIVKGRFSSLMKKMNGKWYLYTDHSS